jgi:hypothetical protein
MFLTFFLLIILNALLIIYTSGKNEIRQRCQPLVSRLSVVPVVVLMYVEKFGTNSRGSLTNGAATLGPISGLCMR